MAERLVLSWDRYVSREESWKEWNGHGTHCCLEDTLVAPVGLRSFLHFRLCRFRVDDSVLSRNLLPIALLVVCLLNPVLLQLLREARLQLSHLRVLDIVVLASRRICLEELDLVLDRGVQDLRLRDHGLQLG